MADEKLILVTNDDGYLAPGISTLIRSIRGLGRIVICAPNEVKHAYGRSHSIHKTIKPEKCEVEGAKGWFLDASPASCVTVALERLLGRKPDLVVSGINRGENMGIITPISGTVGSAAEAAEYGIPALAVSQDIVERGDEVDYSAAGHFARHFTRKILSGGYGFGNYGIINVNVPVGATPETGIMEAVPCQEPSQRRDFTEKGDGFSYLLHFWREKQYPKGTDVWTVYNQKKVAVTFLKPSYGFVKP